MFKKDLRKYYVVCFVKTFKVKQASKLKRLLDGMKEYTILRMIS